MLSLEDLFNIDQVEKKPRKLDVLPCVHREDALPVNLIEPDINKGPWIAGGAALQWYQGKPVGLHDIDVFCRSQEQATALVAKFMSENSKLVFSSENAVTLEYSTTDNSSSWKIQIITKEFFKTVKEVVDRFDITVCKIATDGFSWHKGPQMAADLHTRTLRITQLKPDSIKRYAKYMAYGYRPVDGLFEEILAVTDWNIEPIVGEYDAF